MINAKRDNIIERHGGAVGSALGFGSKHPSSKLGRDNCVEALSPHRVTAVGKLLTLNCLGGDWPSFTFILTLLSSDCGLSVVSNKRILLLLLHYHQVVSASRAESPSTRQIGGTNNRFEIIRCDPM